MRLETVHPSGKEEDRVIHHLDDESQPPGCTETVGTYDSRGAIEDLGLAFEGNRVLTMVDISGPVDDDAMTAEGQGGPVACIQRLPHACISDGVGGLGIAGGI